MKDFRINLKTDNSLTKRTIEREREREEKQKLLAVWKLWLNESVHCLVAEKMQEWERKHNLITSS